MIEFGFNKEKANEVILYLSYRDEWMSKMRLLKFVFFADLYHINHYGRPILGDKYVAMKNGPVLSKLYDMLKQSTDDYEVINRKLIRPHRDANLDYLSKSDIEALNYALNQYSQYETLKFTFFVGGLKSLLKQWILLGCREKPKDLAKIIFDEYNLILYKNNEN